VVVFAGWGGGYGNLVRVRHGNGYETYYAHFSSFEVGCGQAVYQGQVLGYCGSTGWSTGPHLHYEIRLNGAPQNPKLFEP
jgi:murein DD-endopeptidase MepM/ murein hydrolase activator NlpD